MLSWNVAPTAVIVRFGRVWWAEVCGGDCDCTWQAPFLFTSALHLVARSTTQTTIEQNRAQSRRVCSVALTVQIPIPTSSTWSNNPSINEILVRINSSHRYFPKKNDDDRTHTHSPGSIASAVESGVGGLPVGGIDAVDGKEKEECNEGCSNCHSEEKHRRIEYRFEELGRLLMRYL